VYFIENEEALRGVSAERLKHNLWPSLAISPYDSGEGMITATNVCGNNQTWNDIRIMEAEFCTAF
jgi:hypothetical protein